MATTRSGSLLVVVPSLLEILVRLESYFGGPELQSMKIARGQSTYMEIIIINSARTTTTTTLPYKQTRNDQSISQFKIYS
jgi:hypothetical protein